MSTKRSTARKALTTGVGVALAATALSTVGAPPARAADPVPIQIVATNDFHGRILNDPFSSSAGASVLSGAVKQLRTDNPNTVFAAAGDLIGATTFESFVANDKPTIDALNEAGLEVSAVGNHELDQGYDDLVNRVMAPYHPDTNPEGGAEWEYVAANLEETTDNIAESWTTELDGVTVGFVGAVTEELPALVSPTGIADITVTDIVDAVNDEAASLKGAGADLVVMLVHEGSPTIDCASSNFTDENTVWGNITQNTSPDVDAIVSGHTHLAYNCSFPVTEWADRAVAERPVVSAGQYGASLNKLVFNVDPDTGAVLSKTQEVLDLKSCSNSVECTNYPADVAVDPIVQGAIDHAEPIGAQVLGPISAPFTRAKLANGTSENRGAESTLGNLVAEVQRWATPAEQGGAQIAFMNPGGLRADMVGTLDGDVRNLTYRQAAVVQPFANGLVNMDLTGAQIEAVLEEQWQRSSSGTVPTRPFLRLGTSEGFTYTYEETPVTVEGTETTQGEVTGMWLDGEAIDPAASYSVTVNSFLAGGGDNFRALKAGANQEQWGVSDLQAMVAYMDEHTGDTALPVDFSQRAVAVTGVADSYPAGGAVTFDISSWSMSGPDDVKDSAIEVLLGDTVLGSSAVDNTIADVDAVYDRVGSASINVPLPVSTPVGAANLTLRGAQTGTEIEVPITVATAPPVPKSPGCVAAEKGHAQAQASLAKAQDKKTSFKKKLKKANKAEQAKKVKKLKKKLKKAKKQVVKAKTGLANAQANVGKHC